ncbi:SDR family oxidoreductase [Actinoallomurus purpureus]|uniref:NAD(P)-dependent oxidoreductase n=1 Tax=Actinoallomurus purpureus TaxID=478114 RepID=UPI0020922174|nr:SDR family oxidoreductase [Actinoallomurus purpureus]MCO6005809.1 SDR family oxidoreductase [Actinoallomurus purpureus]
MRLTIFGASGGTGTRLVRQALERGHEVTAVVRDPARLAVPAHDRLTVVTADVMDPAAIEPAVAGADAVVSALGHRDTGPTTVCQDGARSIIEAMSKAGVRRFLMVSAAGFVTDAGDGPVTRYVAKPILQRILRHAFADMRRAEEEVRDSDLDWTIVRPPRLIDKEGTGRYRTAIDLNVRGGIQISRADLATGLLDLVPDDSVVRRHVSIAR